MLDLRQTKYDLVLLVVVVLLSIAANLPDGVAAIDRRVLVASLVIILAISLVRYVRVGLVLITAVLAVGANLPEELAVRFGINKNILLLTLAAMVISAIAKRYFKTKPSGDEPEHRGRSSRGAKALFNAVVTDDVNAVKAMVQSGVNVNIRTLTGKTPLMAAAFEGHADMVQMLLNAGANVNARDAEGRTALSIARLKGYSRIVAFLKMGGAEDDLQYLDIEHLTNSPAANSDQ